MHKLAITMVHFIIVEEFSVVQLPLKLSLHPLDVEVQSHSSHRCMTW